MLMIVLASNSPRRRELLTWAGWEFLLAPAEIDERVLPGEAPANYVRRLAQDKALQAWRNLDGPVTDLVVLAADTAVVDSLENGRGDVILGKPADAAQAEAMLRQLRGRSHRVYTGIAVLRPEDRIGGSALAENYSLVSDVVVTNVPMRNYTDEEMRAYIESGDPLDKAGAYAIQHAGFHPVVRLSGCYANVVGLPLCHISLLLEAMSVATPAGLAQSCQQRFRYDCDIFEQVLASAGRTQPE